MVMEGRWYGTYDAGVSKLLFTNDLSMSWASGSYLLTVYRHKFYRYPFHRTSPFDGSGPLRRGQSEFYASYSPSEPWRFEGNYSVAAEQLVYSGRIFTGRRSLGTFRMKRERRCVKWDEVVRDTCDLPDADPIASEENAVQVVDASVSPNPVTAGASLSLSAATEPLGLRRWNVHMSPVDDAGQLIGEWTDRASVFSRTVTAPAPATFTTYRVTFQVDIGNEEVAMDYVDVEVVPEEAVK